MVDGPPHLAGLITGARSWRASPVALRVRGLRPKQIRGGPKRWGLSPDPLRAVLQHLPPERNRADHSALRSRLSPRPPRCPHLPPTVHQRCTLIEAGDYVQSGLPERDPTPPGLITLAASPSEPQVTKTKHFKLIAQPAPQVPAIRECCAPQLARGDRALIADPAGG